MKIFSLSYVSVNVKKLMQSCGKSQKSLRKILAEYFVSNVQDLRTPQLAFSWKFKKNQNSSFGSTFELLPQKLKMRSHSTVNNDVKNNSNVKQNKSKRKNFKKFT